VLIKDQFLKDNLGQIVKVVNVITAIT